MVGAMARGAPGQNLKFLKSMMQKAYCGSTTTTTTDQSSKASTELKRLWSPDEREEAAGDDKPVVAAAESDKKASTWWIPDVRTGIYYPMGQERVMEGIPAGAAAKSMELVHCFSYSDDNVHEL